MHSSEISPHPSYNPIGCTASPRSPMQGERFAQTEKANLLANKRASVCT